MQRAAAASGSGSGSAAARMNDHALRRGHDVRLFVDGVQKELLCGVCAGVLNKPVVACAAGHWCAARCAHSSSGSAEASLL
jgi:hypothetical protein